MLKTIRVHNYIVICPLLNMHIHLSHMHQCNADNDKFSLILKAPYKEEIIIIFVNFIATGVAGCAKQFSSLTPDIVSFFLSFYRRIFSFSPF